MNKETTICAANISVDCSVPIIPMSRETGDKGSGVRLLSIVAISRVDMYKITEIREAWLVDSDHNLIEPEAQGVAFAKPLVGFAARGRWLARAGRCPAGTISEAGHDKVKFQQYLREVTAVHVAQHQFGFRVESCGLYQTKVPCEAGDQPTTEKRG